VKLIHFVDKMELAKLIVTSAPPKALWFNVVQRLSATAVLVDYEPPVSRLSLRVLADELGLVGLGSPERVVKVALQREVDKELLARTVAGHHQEVKLRHGENGTIALWR
jgi:hypothetical protein